MDQQETKLHALKGELPEDFYNRFDRLLAVTRLSVVPKGDDKTREQVAAYIKSVTGSAPQQEKDLRMSAALAFSEEAVRLEMQLDGH